MDDLTMHPLYKSEHNPEGDQTTMGRTIPHNEIPDSTIVPTGTYLVNIDSMESGVTRTPPERLQYKEQLRVVEPTSHANLVLFDSQTIGTEDDRDAEYIETWQQSPGARRLKGLCAAAGVSEEDEDRMIQAVEGQQVLVYVQEYTDDGSYDEKYKGQPRNRISRYYRVGDREPGIEGKGGPMQRTPARTNAAPRPGAQAQQPAQATSAPRPAPAQARPAPGAARPAPAQGQTPTRASLQRPAPAAPAAAKPAPRPAAAKPKPAQVQDVICSLCGEDENGNPYTVPEDQFEAHVQDHEAQAGNA